MKELRVGIPIIIFKACLHGIDIDAIGFAIVLDLGFDLLSKRRLLLICLHLLAFDAWAPAHGVVFNTFLLFHFKTELYFFTFFNVY